MIWSTLLMALREVKRNALRSFLTMLGIMIGVGAVIAMVTIGEGATQKVRNDVSALGDNLLVISPGAARRGPERTPAVPFERQDIEAVEREIGGIKGLAPTAQTSTTIVYGNQNWPSTVVGAEEAYFDVRGYKLDTGRSFSETEITAGTPVCVLGKTVRENLFGQTPPMGQRVRIKQVSCLIIGVLAPKGQAAMGGDQDDVVLMPLKAFQRRVAGNHNIGTVYLQTEDGQATAAVQAQVEDLLRERRRVQPGAADDFTVRNMQEIAETMSSVTSSLTGLLGGIAAVSLLVGGIGIMNIMLVSVTERTREVGTRLAIGALASEVLLQFLVEAVVLAMLGGILGILFGLGMSYAATRGLTLPFLVSPGVVFGAFAFSAAVGVIFGYLPARKAARLNPIEALRHE
ncbi:ABC transporter permease [Polyangium aurulentum]|uniref:ABC transporter permease n=1 Tax=Polyangium aurulentum TaxID=2567896 RepID=UPI0010AED63E|nr:ABC transporter permease [Polyangium aurulentum]UQA63111.1 ABC transporter permease [Polyangium aurulentum]